MLIMQSHKQDPTNSKLNTHLNKCISPVQHTDKILIVLHFKQKCTHVSAYETVGYEY